MSQTEPDAALTLAFPDIAPGDLPRVGGKGANLGVLARAGFPVPPGFCVTTAAYARFLAGLADADARFAELDCLDGNDLDATRKAAAAMRAALETLPMPAPVASAVVAEWQRLGTAFPLAVRSSATAEDLPGASFAGQQDTYLNVRGEGPLLDAVRRCWISLFTDRAVLYRAKNRFGHRGVQLSVVVQRLVEPDVSGILFTADPITGHRGITSIDAGLGLGEALVSGLITADRYRVDKRLHTVLEATPGDRPFAIRSVAGGGTRQEPLPDAARHGRVLDDAQALALSDLGARIEANYGGVPQDIEWCLAQGQIFIVQARPITSLFPVPQAAHPDAGPRIFFSFGHLQMMTDAMPRFARDVWGYFFPTGKAGTPSLSAPARLSPTIVTAGSRLFVDATPLLRVGKLRAVLLAGLDYAYTDLSRSLALLAARPGFAAVAAPLRSVAKAAARLLGPVFLRVPIALLVTDPALRATRTDRLLTAHAQAARARVASAPTPSARIRQAAVELNGIFVSIRRFLPPLLAGVVAHRLLASLAKGAWAEGVRDQVDRLGRGLPGNVTTEMDLRVGDLTDAVRAHAELAALLRERPWPEIRAQLPSLSGGPQFAAALNLFLELYGDRGAGEVDVSRPRWRDDPSMLFRVIAGGLSTPKPPGAHRQWHAAQAAEGEAAQRELVEAAGRGFGGLLRRWWVHRLCRVARFGMGLREHPKFTIVRILGVVRSQALEAGALLVQRGQLASASEVWQLGFDELAQALDDPSRKLAAEAAARQAELRADQPRKPPLVISSEGETPTLAIDQADLPAGALRGTPASNGVVEGLARVIRDPEHEVLHAGEILVAPFTDPGWTPLFVQAAGVVTEVGGLLTHGAVVAREYGIPAVVSVSGALDRIKTGQRLRVDGTRGFVQILDEDTGSAGGPAGAGRPSTVAS